MAPQTHEQSSILCAEQVEIFVPNNPEFIGKFRLFFDQLILEDRIPISGDHRYWLQQLVDQHPEASAGFSPLRRKTFWENLIFGYSIYETKGYFIGPDEQLRRNLTNYFEEPTLAVKLILTNYRTRGLLYPLMQNFADPFQAQQSQAFILNAIASYQPRINPVLTFEYGVMMLHYLGITSYIVDRLSQDIMHNELEIWLQRWQTQLSRRYKPERRKAPIVATEEEKRLKFGEAWEQVICVLDYSTQSE